MAERDIVIEIKAEPRWLRAVRGLVRGYLEAQGVGLERIPELVLAVDEACTNSMRHSYLNDCTQTVTLECSSDASAITVTLRDNGVAASAERIRRYSAGLEQQPLKPGGRGVQILYQVFDEVRYEPGADGRGNVVTMRLRMGAQERAYGIAD